MKINYEYSTTMNLVFDDEFEIVEIRGTLDFAVAKAQWAMSEYGFVTCDIIDSETGEILVRISDE